MSEGVQGNLAARSSRFYASSDPRGEKDQRNEGEELLREKKLDSREYFFISATNNRDY